jgi:hypothetical protein
MKNITEQLAKREFWIDYPYEEAMARTLPEGKYFLKFYGWADEKEVEGDHLMLNEVLRFGEEITRKEYEKGRQ